MNRKPIGKKLRFEILKRDSFTCCYCGSKPPKVVLEIDHIMPYSKGGSDRIENLITSCFDCNRGKSNIELSSIPLSLAEKAAIESEKLEQYRMYMRFLKRKEGNLQKEIDMVEEIYTTRCEYIFTDTFKISIRKFFEQLGFEEVREAMVIACSKQRLNQQKILKYFCGICWTKIREAKNG